MSRPRITKRLIQLAELYLASQDIDQAMGVCKYAQPSCRVLANVSFRHAMAEVARRWYIVALHDVTHGAGTVARLNAARELADRLSTEASLAAATQDSSNSGELWGQDG
jgi:hypothetical protein